MSRQARPPDGLKRAVAVILGIIMLAPMFVIAVSDFPCVRLHTHDTVLHNRLYIECSRIKSLDGALHGTAEGSAATRILGPTRSGLPWHSGVWAGGRFSAEGVVSIAKLRGKPIDLVLTYAYRDNYDEMANNAWPITIWEGFTGRLSYALSPVPTSGEGSLATVAAGHQDEVWAKIARALVTNGRGDSVIRIAWEANSPSWRHGATSTTSATFKKAWRRIQQKMEAHAPDLIFEFNVNCGSGLEGSPDRLAPLDMLYPGDDVVDLVGCDSYDWWDTHASGPETWSKVLHPTSGPGIGDVVEFARDHNKGATVAEWGLVTPRDGNKGGGDNQFYVEEMHDFFESNRDVLAYECYFDQPRPPTMNSLFTTGQNPLSSLVYRALW